MLAKKVRIIGSVLLHFTNMLVSNRSIVTREQLLDVLWDDGAKFVDDNTLSVHISRLREKIGAQHIKTIRGVGYQWLA